MEKKEKVTEGGRKAKNASNAHFGRGPRVNEKLGQSSERETKEEKEPKTLSIDINRVRNQRFEGSTSHVGVKREEVRRGLHEIQRIKRSGGKGGEKGRGRTAHPANVST